MTTLEEWRRYAPPKGRTHWKDGRSARRMPGCGWAQHPAFRPALRRCFDPAGAKGMFVRDRLNSRRGSSSTPLEGGAANIDVLVKAEDEYGPIVIGIEAKTDEAFGSTVGNTLSRAQERLDRAGLM